MVRAWHTDPTERYDFSAGKERIEVKCAVGRSRVHHFTLEQLTPPATTVVLVASVCTERSGGGTSLEDLLVGLRSRVSGDPQSLFHLEVVVGATLGRTVVEALEESFDREMADQSLAFFDVAAVPRPGGEIPKEVTEVRFVTDLTHVEAVEPAVKAGANGLFEAALPV
jgi:hypothetical protein